MQSINQGFHLKELPSPIEKLKDSPEVLRYVFFSKIQPAAEAGQIDQYLKEFNSLTLARAEEMPEELVSKELKPEEISFLFTHLIEALERYPKFMVLIYLFHLICKIE
jgi:hypothetical protein